MKPWEDTELVQMIARWVDERGPIQPIVDRCIEMGHHAEDLSRWSMLSSLGRPLTLPIPYHGIWMLGSNVNDMLENLGHKELADWIPF